MLAAPTFALNAYAWCASLHDKPSETPCTLALVAASVVAQVEERTEDSCAITSLLCFLVKQEGP